MSSAEEGASSSDGHTFHVSLGASGASTALEGAIIAAFLRRGWTAAPSSTARLVWLPASRHNWDAALETGAITAAYPVRTALVRKDALVATARRARVRTPVSAVVTRGVDGDARAAALAHAGSGPWLVKEPTVNNALGLRFARTRAELDAVVTTSLASSRTAVVQEYVEELALVRGAKWHARVNVLAVGSCAVYVHAHAVAHIATEPFARGEDPTERPAAHITNNVVQRRCPAYERERHTVGLTEFLSAADVARLSSSFNSIVRAIFDTALTGKRVTWEPLPVQSETLAPTHAGVSDSSGSDDSRMAFLPLPQSFELFGFDFLVSDTGEPILLEINGGPALEGGAWPELCVRVADESVALLVENLRPRVRGAGDDDALPTAWDAPPVPAEGSGWVRVR
jgi:hypothetical protein